MSLPIPSHATFASLQQFQDSLFAQGIAGNDVSVFHAGKPVYRYMTGYSDVEARLPITPNTLP